MGRNIVKGFKAEKHFNFSKRISVPKGPVEVKAINNNRIAEDGTKERKCNLCGEWKKLDKFVIRYYLPIGTCLDCNSKRRYLFNN